MGEPARDREAIAAKGVYDLLIQCLRSDQGVHAETAICAAGAVTGDAIAQAAAELATRPADAAATAGPDALQARIDRVESYVRERCKLLQVVLPEAEVRAIPDSCAPVRDAASLAGELRSGVARIVAQVGIPPEQVPFVVARTIPALLSNTSAVLDPGIGYAIASRALRATVARTPGNPQASS